MEVAKANAAAIERKQQAKLAGRKEIEDMLPPPGEERGQIDTSFLDDAPRLEFKSDAEQLAEAQEAEQ